MAKKKYITTQTDFKQLQQLVDKMHYKHGFCLRTLKRKFTPYLWITISKNYFNINAKGQGGGIRCIFDSYNEGIATIVVYYIHGIGYEPFELTYTVRVNSNKEFMQKIIEHNLLTLPI